MNTKKLLQAAIIAAIYTALTIALAPISYGPMQLRVSEALTVMPHFTSAAIPGLFVGCLISNMLGPYGAVDIICGSTATLMAAFCSHRLRNRPLFVPLPPIIANGIIVGGMLNIAYGVPNIWACMLWIALGQAAVCYGLGFPLMKLLEKYKGVFD